MSTEHLDLSDKAVTAKLAPTPPKKGEQPVSLADVVKGLTGDRKLFLVVKDLRTNTQPGVTYSVYLDLPVGATPELTRKHYVGTINFFNASVARDPAKAAKSDRFQSFDVTKLVKTLSASGKLGEKLTVSVVPDDLPDLKSKPRIGELSLVEQ
jgi:tyrosinase